MRDEQERPAEPDGGEVVAPAGIPEGTPPHSTDDDVRVLGGVGGAMRDEDAHPHLVDELNAGEIYVPIMEEAAGDVPPVDLADRSDDENEPAAEGG